MSSPASSIGLLQAQLAEIRKSHPSARLIGFHLPSPWNGPSTMRVGGEDLPLVFCPSPLAFRAQLVQREGSEMPIVLLTDRSEQQLGADVLCRLFRRRLFSLNSWQALRDRFGVREIDPRLFRLRWLPDYLLADSSDEIVHPPTQILDAEEVWQLLLTRLGFPNPQPDLQDLLEWTTSVEQLATFSDLPPDAQADHVRRLAESTGVAGLAVLQMAAAGRGGAVIAAGLVGELLFGASVISNGDSARAAVRFEELLLAGATIEPEVGREWASAAAELVRRRFAAAGEDAIAPWLDQAEQILAELKIKSFAERSGWLASGLDDRIARFADKLTRWLDRPEAAQLPELIESAKLVRRHGLASGRESEVSAVAMLLRLGRYLAYRKGHPAAASFAAASASYVQDGSFADLARTVLSDAYQSNPLAAVRDQVLRAVADQRETENRRFAELLAKWFEAPAATAALVPIESALEQLVAPLTAACPVLLLVLDGMSLAVFRQLALDLPHHGWEELRPTGTASRPCGVALLPSVTQVCRTSLLCGDRMPGNATTESQGFAQNAALRQHCSPGLPPVVFHKSDLASHDGPGLSESVRREVERPGRRIVGVILNVVDNQLTKGRQLLPSWEVSTIRFLGELLESAAAAGRAIVVTSDHGHLVERETDLHRQEGGGARFRPAGPPPGEGEVAVRGPRVLMDGSSVIVAWSERLRYSSLQSGYHGGASPQEILVPLSFWAPFGSTVRNWEPFVLDTPDWWRLEAADSTPSLAPKARVKASGVAQAQGSLFASAAPVQPAVIEPWLADLFASPIYREQRSRAERQGLTDELIGATLKALAQRGGRMPLPGLAHQLAISLPRVQGLVAALQRVLNVEGFPVLSLDPESETAILDRSLLAAQFLVGRLD